MPRNEILLEMQRIGNSVRVTAIDPASGTEVTFQVPASISQADMKQMAVNKLTYVLRKQKQ
ncbi:MAG: hypothetical protein M3N08_01015 [Pseudomonadota bacterium]|nr:hypothetical protein [Pseudomonadota bacterium]